MFRVVILIIFQCFLLTTGHVSFKLAVDKIDKFSWSWSCFVDCLTNWWFFACGTCLISATILWGFILRHFDFSIAYPVTAFAYVFGMLAAIFVFHETVSITRWVGVILIVLGTCFIVR